MKCPFQEITQLTNSTMKASHRITKKHSQGPSQSPRAARPTHITTLAQGVVQIAKVNSEIASISSQLRRLEVDSDSSPSTRSASDQDEDLTDDILDSKAISALLNACELDSQDCKAGDQDKKKRIQCPAELQERLRKLQRLPRLGRLVRIILQQQYPLSWERLLQS